MAVNVGTAVAYLELDTSKFTSGFKSALKDLDSFKSKSSTFSQKLKGLSSAIGTVGSTLTKNVTVPLAGAGTALSAFAVQAEKATKKVTTYFGDTGEQAEKNGDIIKDVFSSGIPESMEEAADAIILVRQNIEDLNDADLATVSEQALVLEKTFGSDMSESIRGASSLMVNFGLDSQEAMDYLVAATENGLDKTHELGDNIAEYGQLWSQAGFSASEMFSILESGLDSGAYNLDKVNDFVKEFTISLSDGRIEESINSFSEGTQQLFNEYKNGEATAKEVFFSVINDLETTMSKQEALTVASNTWSALGEDNALQVISALNDVGSAYDDVNGKAQEMIDNQTSGASGAIAELKNNAEILASEVGESLVPNVERLNEIVKDVTEWFRGLNDEQKETAATVGTVVAVIGPLLLILSKVITAIVNIGKSIGTVLKFVGSLTGLTKVFAGIAEVIALVAGGAGTLGEAIAAVFPTLTSIGSTIASVFSTVGSVLASVGSAIASFVAGLNPIVIVIAAVVAAIVGLVAAIKTNFLGIGDLFDSLANTIVTFFTETIPEAFDSFVDYISQLPGQIGDFLSGLWDSITETFSGIVDSIVEGLTGAVDSIVSFFTEIIPEAFSTFVNETIPNFIDSVIVFFQELPYNLGYATGQMLGHLYLFATNAQAWVQDQLANIVNSIITFFQTLPERAYAVFTTLLDSVISLLTSLWNGIVSIVTSIYNSVSEWAANMAQKAIEMATNFLNNVITFFSQLPGNIVNFVTTAYNNVVSWASNMIAKAREMASNFLSNVVSFFSQLPGRIQSLLSSAISNVVSWASNMVNRARQMASDFVNNVITFFSELPGRIRSIIEQIPGIITSIGTQLYNAGRNILNSLWNGLKSIGNGIIGWIQDFANNIASFIGGIINGFKSVVGASNEAKSAARSVDGSHAGGLSYVPYNGYIAELHEGERVLTKQENQDYNSGRTSGGDTFIFNQPLQTPYEYARAVKRARKEILA